MPASRRWGVRSTVSAATCHPGPGGERNGTEADRSSSTSTRGEPAVSVHAIPCYRWLRTQHGRGRNGLSSRRPSSSSFYSAWLVSSSRPLYKYSSASSQLPPPAANSSRLLLHSSRRRSGLHPAPADLLACSLASSTDRSPSAAARWSSAEEEAWDPIHRGERARIEFAWCGGRYI